MQQMKLVQYFFLLFLPLLFAYPNPPTNDYERFLSMYAKQRSAHQDTMKHGNLDDEYAIRQQQMFPFFPMQHQQPGQFQQMCLPHIWTCGPNLPPCCPGLMCYDGNAKRGRHCVARG
ncbi:unnamed protein product [Adineta ricciae]|uniref:Uncharacterized protein n=1 Tax=Adineta ricciae TaxID=249248 RepID=A0A815S1A3_ADIRI|nr:unnamed protein product [Adineta ricciae]CAF1483568.1 unnamed protein product [Adineta ricciae]